MVKRILLLLVLFMMLATGCWDMKDIEERLYVSGVAFDEPDPAEVERQRAILEEPDVFAPEFLVTYVSPVPTAQIRGVGGEAYVPRSITAVTPDEAERQMANRINLDLFFGHAKLVLFGEEILKDEFKVREMYDYLHRNQEYKWSVLVGVVEGRASDAFNIKIKGQIHLIDYITGIMENRPVSSRVSDVTLSQALSDSVPDGTLALPRVLVSTDEIKVEGAAVIKDFKFLGYLSGVEGRSIMFLKGTLEGGSVLVQFKNEFIPYNIVNAGVKKDLKVTQEGIQLTYAIETEGQLNEGVYGGDFVTNKNIKAVEAAVEREIVQDCMRVIHKLQKDFRTDLIYADNYIRKYHPKVWKEVGEDWENFFSELDIRVTADVKIRRTGVVK